MTRLSDSTLTDSTLTAQLHGWSVPAAWAHTQRSQTSPIQSQQIYQLKLAETAQAVREAQQLRHRVFSAEYGVAFPGSDGLDSDEFDRFCDHLIVRHTMSAEVVGTYRMLLPKQAKKIDRYYSQGEFFMTRLLRQIPGLVELGRSCVHPDHRNGSVIMMLWSGIVRHMQQHHCSHMIGCASVSMRDGGKQAATLWDRFYADATIMADPLLETFPKNALPLETLTRDPDTQLPPLMRGYFKVGAKVCGEPNWDPDFNTADFLLLMDMSAMSPRYARHFGLN